MNIITLIKFKDLLINSKVLTGILSYLEKEHKQQYTFSSNLQIFINQTQSLLELSDVVNLLTGICIVIVLIGLIGLILLMMNKRKKETAISIAIGATLAQLYLEVVLEIMIIIGIGGIVGIIASNIILLHATYFNEFPISINPLTPIIISIASLIISILISIFPLFKIREISPNKALKSQ